MADLRIESGRGEGLLADARTVPASGRSSASRCARPTGAGEWDAGYDSLTLHTQVRVQEFYEALGYGAVGDAFAEAGIPHVEMVRGL